MIDIDQLFPVPLSEKIIFEEYVTKIFTLGEILVAEDEEDIVGILTFYSNNKEKKEGSYSILAISEQYRQLGIASKLCEKSFNIMKSKGMHSIYTYTHKDNENAISFYTRLGFEIDLKRPNWYEYNVSLLKYL